ncbi:MAG: hypothetical protein LBD75_07880 [Candidatus Peribacteria bacterium]|nr:hypothetical protein [Candidatus Peribacteria bacterium]
MAIIATVMMSNVVAQDNTTNEKTLTLTGDIRTGAGYAPLFGSKTSNQWSLFYSVDVQHKSGIGLGAFRMTDFQSEGLGKIAFFDLYWSGKIAKNLSLYGAIEYGFMDNNSQMSCWCPYVMLFWTNPIANVDISPMCCYYEQLKSAEIIIRLRATKSLWKTGEIQLSGWCNNALQQKFYGAVGIRQQLPKNFYLQGDILFREGRTEPIMVLGRKF